MHPRILLCSYQHTKFEMHSFTDSKEMIGAKLKKTGHITLTMPTRELPAYKIWQLLLQPFWRYVWASKLKMYYVILTMPHLGVGWFVILQLGHDIIYLYIKFDDSLQLFQRYHWGPRIYNGSRNPDHANFKGDLSAVFWDLM